jgi:iron(III) transport system permease protein
MSLKSDLYIRPDKANRAVQTKRLASPIHAGTRPWIGWRLYSFIQDSLAAVAGRSHLLLVIFAGLVAGLILLVPLYLLLRTIGVGAEAISTLFSQRTALVMGNTVLLAVAVTVGATVVAVPLAWLTAATDLPGRRMWTVLVAMPLILPSYVAAFIFISLLSPKGLVQQLLQPVAGIERLPSLYGFPGAFLVLTLITYPLIFLTVRGAILRLDPSLEEAARNLGLGPRQVFWRVTLPHLRPGILAGSLLVTLYVLRDFGAVTTLQYNTFTRIIYNRYLSYRLDMAALFALVLVIMALIILFLEQRSRGRARYARLSSGCSRRRDPARLGKWKAPALAFTGAITTLALGLPLAGLLYWVWRGWQGQQVANQVGTLTNNLMTLSGLLEPAWHSFSASLLAAVLTTLLALPIAILVVRRPGRLSWLLERVAYISYALPGIVVALAFVFFGIHILPSLYQTLPMMLAAYAILFIPLAIGAVRATLQQMSPSLEEAGRSLGQKPWAVLRRITLPLIWPGLIAGALLIFLTAMKELPVTLILSPLGFNTLAEQVWTNMGEAFFARAALPTLLLLILSSIPLAWLTIRDSRS